VEFARPQHCVGLCGPVCSPSRGNSKVPEGDWRHVGTGMGAYDVVSSFEFVGDGCGSYVPYGNGHSWRFRPACKALTALIIIVAVVVALIRCMGSLAPIGDWGRGLPLASSEPVDCGNEDSLDSAKRAFCCSKSPKLCASLAPASSSPSPAQIDCSEGLSNWRRGWSEAKKSWCCAREHKGCEAVLVPATIAPTTTQALTSLPPVPFLPYMCDTDEDGWQTTWSDMKKAWCCNHKNRGCSA